MTTSWVQRRSFGTAPFTLWTFVMDWIGLAPYVCLGLSGCGLIGSGFVAWLVKRVDTNERDMEKGLASIRAVAEQKIGELRDQLAAQRLHVAETYVTQEGLTKALSNLDITIQRLIDAVDKNSRETRDAFSELHRRIDGKADK